MCILEKNCQVLLIGFEGQENLGLRSLAAYLGQDGISVGIQPLQGVPWEFVLDRALRDRPKIVGFSLIFQRMLADYAQLIAYLRQNGVEGHFTIGGHFPTFAFETLLSEIPGLDTVVMHEGEETLREIFYRLDDPDSWKDIRGLAYRTQGAIKANAPRRLIEDLDSLPLPIRDAGGTTHRGIDIRSLSGSRGCRYNCSFCSISEFYRTPPGAARRTRSPLSVVGEMMGLYEQYGTRIFIFQDDDLLMRTSRHRQWLNEFLTALQKASLADKILWRVSCRVDDLDHDSILLMRESGLASLYLGIESASNHELRTLNKGYSSGDVYRAVEMLNRVGMPFEFGFMLFTPDSTLQTVRENIDFLHFVAGSSDALVHFCKMAPYAGTPIQKRLSREGRLLGSISFSDYRFLDGKLDLLQAFIGRAFNRRNFDDSGLVERLRFAKFDACVMRRFGPAGYVRDGYEGAIRELIKRCNESALDVMGFATAFVEQNSEDRIMEHWGILEDLQRREMAVESDIEFCLSTLMSQFGFLSGGQDGETDSVECEQRRIGAR